MTDPRPTSLGHLPEPGKRWEFDRSVTTVFDDMIARSIPGYESMRAIIGELALPFLESGVAVTRLGEERRAGALLDVGCSTGLGIQQFAGRARKVVGIEISQSMLEAARQRFVSFANVTILEYDLRRGLPLDLETASYDVVLSIFTLQFVPMEHRRLVVMDSYCALRPGGAMFVAEKTICETHPAQALLRDHYHAFKRAQGYSAEEVERKALALEGSLVAQTDESNVAMLRAAGFQTVEPIWRWGSFAAWIAIK